MRLLLLTLLIGALMTPLLTAADRMQTFGQWDVHYMVLPTTMLSADVASAYGIQRANNRAFANIAVMDNEAESLAGMPSDITGEYTNLVGQSRELTFQQVVEGDAVYYIAEFRFPHRERLRFDIQFQPQGDPRGYTLTFEQSIYQEGRP